MLNEITQEQAVKYNVMIMKWLGHTLCQIKDCSSSKIEEEMRADWLSSPEGEVAMMDKLEANGWDINNRKVKNGRSLQIIRWDDDLTFSGALAPTRNAALQLAISEILEDREIDLP